MLTMKILEVEFHFFSFAGWSSEQHARADLCRADLCCQLCPGPLGDPQKVIVSTPLKT